MNSPALFQKKNALIALCLGFLLLQSGCNENFRFTPEDPDWKTYKSDDFGFSLDSPYPLKFTNHDFKAKNGTTVKYTTAWAYRRYSFIDGVAMAITHNRTLNLFSVWAYSQIGDKKGPDLGLKKSVKGEQKSQAGTLQNPNVKNFQTKTSFTQCSGLPAALTLMSYDLYDKKGNLLRSDYTQTLIVVRGKQLWQVNVRHHGSEGNAEMADRILKSFKIEAKVK